MTWPRRVLPDLPTFVDDDDDNVRQIHSVLDYTGTQLLWQFRDATGNEREAVREQLRRFREETLAGVITGPHIPMGEMAAAKLRALTERIDVTVAMALNEP
jgi:hypothetical protein